jgi:hypothetical protein
MICYLYVLICKTDLILSVILVAIAINHIPVIIFVTPFSCIVQN